MKIILKPETASKLIDLVTGIKKEHLSAVTPIKLSFTHSIISDYSSPHIIFDFRIYF